MTPLVSVIIPCFNRRHLIARALDSVFAQTYASVECIVIDDGSKDNTAEFIATHYPKVHLHRQENRGVSAARNEGIRLAQGEWIAFLDSDDAWDPNKLTQQIAALQQEKNYRLCHTDEIWIRNGKRVNPMNKHQKSGGWIYPACLALCLISPSSVLLEKKLLEEVELFDESLPACEDYDLWLRITSQYPVLYLQEKLTIKYGGHKDQLSRKYWGMDRFRIQAMQKMLNSPRLSDEYRLKTLNTLKNKIEIYLVGAKKRGKYKEMEYYKSFLADL